MVLEQFVRLSDGCCVFWQQLADDGFDFLEIFGVEQNCIYLGAHLVGTGSGGRGTSGQTSFQIMMQEGAFTKILFTVEMRSLTSGDISWTDSQTRWRPWARQGVWGRRPLVPGLVLACMLQHRREAASADRHQNWATET